ncbi:hypothetical protein B0F90DRAFT_1837672 [Multifurca ochricompacta]|uniref:Brain protein I3 n=1 Tax=Multifurca ochricompacta TaxID=376703 RepID=A0AAD4QJS9_9AGAM|nr:hypothetical protein B0F90DRAFT_1837672 [Multifurca ochricompacta]
MIIDIQITPMMHTDPPVPIENPPAYVITKSVSRYSMTIAQLAPPTPSKDLEPVVYHYHDIRTGQLVTSLLPPDHPQMVCLQSGSHVPESRYGFFGVLAAIVWFPLGIGLCLLDRRVRCVRCGESLEDGLCS